MQPPNPIFTSTLERLNNLSMEPDVKEREFYRAAMYALIDANIPFLVGGAYAFAKYSGIARHTKDFDIFVMKRDADAVLAELAKSCGCKVDQTFPHWLYKAYLGEHFIDVIFSSGNGVAVVDDEWFTRSRDSVVLGVQCKIIPAEEMIWSKGFIMERERFDGADVIHTLRGWGTSMDWHHLIQRFDAHWRVLYTHVIIYGYIYPAEMGTIPGWVIETLSRRLVEEQQSKTCTAKLCMGTFLSREQYLRDISDWGYADARTSPDAHVPTTMTDKDVAHWTAAISHGSAKP